MNLVYEKNILILQVRPAVPPDLPACQALVPWSLECWSQGFEPSDVQGSSFPIRRVHTTTHDQALPPALVPLNENGKLFFTFGCPTNSSKFDGLALVEIFVFLELSLWLNSWQSASSEAIASPDPQHSSHPCFTALSTDLLGLQFG